MLSPRVESLLVQSLQVAKTDKVLEIGSGSGYVTAILAKLVDFVYTVEIDEVNKQFALRNLVNAGITNVSLIHADAIEGFVEKAPYDKIFIGGALRSITLNIKQQLKIGGRLVGIVGSDPVMHAVLITRESEDRYHEQQLFETSVDYLTNVQSKSFVF